MGVTGDRQGFCQTYVFVLLRTSRPEKPLWSFELSLFQPLGNFLDLKNYSDSLEALFQVFYSGSSILNPVDLMTNFVIRAARHLTFMVIDHEH